MEVNSNPFEQKDSKAKGSGLTAPTEFESLSDTVKIERLDFDNIVSTLEGEDSNELRIKTLHILKTPYLFSSEQLIALLHITPSVKTRIAFIEEIGPRLTDPKAKSSQIVDMFRYSEEKKQVESVLKARAQTVSKQSTFSRGKSQSVLNTGGGGRGRGVAGRGGGRGGGGRGGINKSASETGLTSPPGSTSTSGGGRGGGRGGAGRGAGRGTGRGGRGASASPTSSTSTTTEISATPVVVKEASKEDIKEDIKEESKEEPSKPVWNPPPRRESFVSPEIGELGLGLGLPRKSITEVKPIAMKKRFSSRPSIRTSNSLSTVEDAEKEDGEDSSGEEEEKGSEKESKVEIDNKTQLLNVEDRPTEHRLSDRRSSVATRQRAERRESSFCATTSVMSALGFDNLDVLTTDDIGRESWDIKAEGSKNNKNVPNAEAATKLKDIAATTRAKENSDTIDDRQEADTDEVELAQGMRTSEDFRKDPTVSQVKPNRVSLQELQERRRVVKVKTLWEKGFGSNTSAKENEYKNKTAVRRKSTRVIAQEERMAQYSNAQAEGPIGVDEATGRYA